MLTFRPPGSASQLREYPALDLTARFGQHTTLAVPFDLSPRENPTQLIVMRTFP